MCCETKIDVFCKVSVIIVILLIVILIFVNIFINNTQDRDILVSIARPGDNTDVGNAIINFSINEIIVGNALSHAAGSEDILINETGIYQISYQLDGVGQLIGTFNFNAILLVNDTPLEDTLNQGPVIREDFSNRMTLTSTVILRLNSGDVLNLGGISLESIIYERARIDIEKIGWGNFIIKLY